jgi:hypothetical protein
MKVFVYGRGELSNRVVSLDPERFTLWFDLAEAVCRSSERIAIIVLNLDDLDQAANAARRTSYMVAVVLQDGNRLLLLRDGRNMRELPNGLGDVDFLN